MTSRMTSSQSPDLKREEYGRQTNGAAQHCTGWRDIESAPKDGSPFVACLPRYERTETFRWAPSVGRFVLRNGFPSETRFDCFTHWMPLPAPPIAVGPPEELPMPPYSFQKPDYGSGFATSSSEEQPLGSSEAEGKDTRDEVKTLRAQLALAVGVLRPFADAFDINSADGDCLDLSDWEAMLNHICIHDFRKASRTLAALSPQEGEKASPHD